MNLLVMAVIVLCAASVAIAVMFAVRRRAKVDEFLTDTTRGSAIFGVIGTAFAVLLAFVMFVAFESFNEARDSSEREAAEVNNIFHTSEYFSSAERDELRGELDCYARAVVHQEWDAMRDGESAPGAEHWRDELSATMRKLDIRTVKEESGHAELLAEDGRREDARRERLLEGEPVISAPVWFILGLGGLATVSFVLLFTDRRESFAVQASLMGMVAALVAASLVLVWFLDHPYQGAEGSIEPDEMERAIAEMEGEAPALAPPCTQNGDPAAA